MTKRPKRLLDQVCDAIQLKHYSIRTKEAHVNWIRRYLVLNRGGMAVHSPLDQA